MTRTKPEFEYVEPGNLKGWAVWLSKNHRGNQSIWLVLPKKGSSLPYFAVEEAILEALCWGWIDSTPGFVDDERYKVRFSKRNPKSNWSRVNKDRIEKLQAEGRMQTPGIQMVEQAKATGTWDALNDVDNLIIPEDLENEFAQYDKAKEYFTAFAPSTRRGILEWIFTAKRAETRIKRIRETAELASRNEKANQFTRKG